MEAAMLARPPGHLRAQAALLGLMVPFLDLILGHHRVDLPHVVVASGGSNVAIGAAVGPVS